MDWNLRLNGLALFVHNRRLISEAVREGKSRFLGSKRFCSTLWQVRKGNTRLTMKARTANSRAIIAGLFAALAVLPVFAQEEPINEPVIEPVI